MLKSVGVLAGGPGAGPIRKGEMYKEMHVDLLSHVTHGDTNRIPSVTLTTVRLRDTWFSYVLGNTFPLSTASFGPV